MNEQLSLLDEAKEALKVKTTKDVPRRIVQLNDELKTKDREIESLTDKLGNMDALKILDDKQDVDGVPVVAAIVEDRDMDALRSIADELKQKLDSGIVVLGTSKNGKVNLVTTVSKDLFKQVTKQERSLKRQRNFVAVAAVADQIWHKQVEKTLKNYNQRLKLCLVSCVPFHKSCKSCTIGSSYVGKSRNEVAFYELEG